MKRHAEDQENLFPARCHSRRSVHSVTNGRRRKSPLKVRRPRGQFCCQRQLQARPGSGSSVRLCGFKPGARLALPHLSAVTGTTEATVAQTRGSSWRVSPGSPHGFISGAFL